tara:strand:- start:60 stop:485 length:426 start_codon:yes stop_codon:yes gene_type:complete
MKKLISKILLITVIITFSNTVNAESNYYNNGKNFFDKKNYKKAKFYFEKDIVFNPKSEKSYLYLAKIFKIEDKNSLEENNLNTTILLNPKNEEAIYNLVLLNIKKSNFSKSKELIKTFDKVCKTMCSSKKTLQEKLNNSKK